MHEMVPTEACTFRFMQARGPGGQHVNKTSTAVELRVDLERLELPPGVLTRLKSQQRNRINKDGELVVQADQYRSQLKNRQDAVERVAGFISTARVVPKKRIATKPSRRARANRIESKKQRGQIKNNRKKPTLD